MILPSYVENQIKWRRARYISKIFHDAKTNIFDIKQGCIGNCFLIAAIHAFIRFVEFHPAYMPLAFLVLGLGQDFDTHKGWFKFKFFSRQNTLTDEVTVDDWIPTNRHTGQPAFARANAGNEMWPPIFEKAVLVSLGSDYAGIDKGGDPRLILAKFLPHQYVYPNELSREQFLLEHKTGRHTTVWFAATLAEGGELTSQHAYTLVSGATEVEFIDPRLGSAPPEPATASDGLARHDGLWKWTLDRLDDKLMFLRFVVPDEVADGMFGEHVKLSFWLPSTQIDDETLHKICVFVRPVEAPNKPTQGILNVCFKSGGRLSRRFVSGVENFFSFSPAGKMRQLGHIECLDHYICVLLVSSSFD